MSQCSNMQKNTQGRKVEIDHFYLFGEKRYILCDVPADGFGQAHAITMGFTSKKEAKEYIRNCGGARKLLATYERV